MKKRALSFFLLIVMLISLFPAEAFAVDISAEDPVLTAENPDPSEDKFEEAELDDMPDAEEEPKDESDPAEDPAAETVPEESDSVSSVMGEAVNGEDKNGENAGDDKEDDTGKDTSVTTTAEGSCGAEGVNLKWKLDSTGTLTISGTGAMGEYAVEEMSAGATNVPWYSHRASITSVVIELGVTTIGSYAFNKCAALTSISIPESVTKIGYMAFNGCEALTAVTIPNSVTTICQLAFNECGVASVTIPAAVGSIELRAFTCCYGLTEINVDANNSNYKSVDGVLFNKAGTELICFPAGFKGSYVIPDGVTKICANAFLACGYLTGITIPESVTTIEKEAFYCCDSIDIYYNGTYAQWETISVGDGNDCLTAAVVSFGDLKWKLDSTGTLTISGTGKMTDCSTDAAAPWASFKTNIKSVVIGSGVTSVGAYAFSGCAALTRITIPKSVTSIGNNAFDSCSVLTDVYYLGTSVEWKTLLNNVGSSNKVLSSTAVHFGEKTAAAKAFADALISAKDGETITLDQDIRISNEDYNVNSRLIVKANNVTIDLNKKTLTVPNCTLELQGENITVTNGIMIAEPYKNSAQTYGSYVIAVAGKNAVIDGITMIGGVNVTGTNSLNDEISVTITNCNITGANYYTICAQRYSKAHVKNSILKNGTGMILWCEKKDYKEGDDAPAIESSILTYDLNSLTIYDASGKLMTPKDDNFYNIVGTTPIASSGTCGKDLKWSYDLAGKLTISGTGAMTNYSAEAAAPWAPLKTSIQSVVIGSGVTSVGAYAFSGCTALTSITIPEGVTSIGEGALENCPSVDCEHSWQLNTAAGADNCICYICKRTQDHKWNAETGVCEDCKKPCEHNWDVDAGVCKTCGNVCEPEITLNNTYLMLKEGSTATLTAKLTATLDPDFWAKSIKWSIDGADGIITLDDADKITAVKAGTAYAVATIKFSGDRTFTAHCRVDVIAEDAVDNMKVQAGATSLTTELFSKDYAVLDILLIEGENKTTAANEQKTTASNDSTGIEITAAEFVDEDTKKIFDLELVEGAKQLRIVPKAEYATLAKASEVKSSYTSKIKVTFAGKVQETEAVKLTVKKTQPKLKATVGTFNSFYSGQSEAIEITGATVNTIAVNTSKKNIDWVNLDAANKTLTLNEKAPLKSASGNVYLSVMTDEWTVPASVTLSVKNTYKAPKLKLSASSAKFNLVSSDGVELTLLPSVKDETLAQHNVNSLEVSEGYKVSGFDRETGAFKLNALKNAKAGKVTFSVGFDDTNTKVNVTLSAQIITPTIKLKTSSVTLNPKYDDSAAVDMVVTPADFVISGDTVKAESADENLKAEIVDGRLVVSAAKDALEYSKSYKVTVSIGSKKAVLTVKTAKKDADPTATVKATGAIDLTYPDSAAAITATVKNYGGEFTGYKGTVTVKTGKTTSEPQEIDELFEVTQNGKVLTLAKKEGVVLNAGSTYTATITLADDENGIEITAKPVKITVKQTAVNLKLSKSSISLNKKAGDTAAINVTCSTKDYKLENANVNSALKITDKKGIPYSVDNEPLDVSYAEGVLTVGVNDKTAYGATYKVLVSAGEGYKASTLTVTVLSSKKDATVSLKASGSIDVLRGGSKVTLTPTYKNVNVVPVTEKVKIYSNEGSKTFATDATDKFAVNGREITNVSASSAYKYKAQIVTTFSNGYHVESAKVAITVKSGSAKMKVVGTPRLYQKDAFARGEFSLTSTDSTLNGIAKVEMKSSKTAGYFELYNYGNGQFAIGFKGDTIAPAAAKLKTATVTLNIWHEGNTTAKADSTVSLKITIVK